MQIAGVQAIASALADGAPSVRLLLVRKDCEDPEVAHLVERAAAQGIPVERASAADLRRLSRVDPPAEVLALTRRDPTLVSDRALALPGAKWLIVGVEYPGNAGAAIRTAEVSGADAVFLDSGLDHEGRRRALRTSMNAPRFLPVFWREGAAVIEEAREAKQQVIGLETHEAPAPWEVDLTGPTLFVVGGEERGLPPGILARCHGLVRIPMRGFIPSYNLQAAVAAVASERLRQLDPA